MLSWAGCMRLDYWLLGGWLGPGHPGLHNDLRHCFKNKTKITKKEGQSAGKLWEEQPGETARSLTRLPISLHV